MAVVFGLVNSFTKRWKYCCYKQIFLLNKKKETERQFSTEIIFIFNETFSNSNNLGKGHW